jgi:MYXO-CTERM domain-containing protein
MVTAVMPGQTLSVSVTSTIAHPGWWRIALHEGASSTQTLTTLPDPVPMAGTNCTPAIMMNPVWSPTQPVLADGLPAGSTVDTVQSGSKTFQVTIPQNANCSTAKPCSLQVIMVMTDHPPNNCYYHHCADITTSGGAADAGPDSSSTGGSDASTSKDAQSSGAGGSTSGPGAGGSTGVGGSGDGGSSMSGAGGSSSGPGAGGATGTAGSTSTTMAGPTTTTTGGTQSSGATGGAAGSNGGNDNGCSCRVGSTDTRSMGAGYGMLLGLGLALLKRRRSR